MIRTKRESRTVAQVAQQVAGVPFYVEQVGGGCTVLRSAPLPRSGAVLVLSDDTTSAPQWTEDDGYPMGLTVALYAEGDWDHPDQPEPMFLDWGQDERGVTPTILRTMLRTVLDARV